MLNEALILNIRAVTSLSKFKMKKYFSVINSPKGIFFKSWLSYLFLTGNKAQFETKTKKVREDGRLDICQTVPSNITK